MAFEIIIKEVGTQKKNVQDQWQEIGETFMDESDIKKLAWDEKRRVQDGELKDLKKAVYGYPPAIEKEVSFEKEVFRQTVTELDLTAVVKAVNKI
jgi:hypothetical protein